MSWQDYLRDEMIDQNVVIGTDSNNYICKLNHRSKNSNRPITGVDWATYWQLTTEAGSVWVASTNYHVAQMDQELSGLSDSVSGIDASITHWTHWQDVYVGIQNAAKSSLEAQLAVKVTQFQDGNLYTAWQPNHSYSFGTYVRPTVANNFKYVASDAVYSAWIALHAYNAGDIVKGNGYLHQAQNSNMSDGIEPTWNTMVGGNTFETFLTWTNIGALTSGLSGGVEPVWPTTPGNSVVDNQIRWTCYAVSISIVYGANYNVLNIYDWRLKDSGATIYQYYPAQVNWDSDAILIKAFTDWGTMYPLIHSTSPDFPGTTQMLANLATARVLVEDWRSKIEDRNSILRDYD